jgi:hypothetical protein
VWSSWSSWRSFPAQVPVPVKVLAKVALRLLLWMLLRTWSFPAKVQAEGAAKVGRVLLSSSRLVSG